MSEAFAVFHFFIHRYCPPLLWGKSGHFQTVVGGFYGRRSPPELKGTLHVTQLGDGTVVTYEIFQPDKNSSSGDKQVCKIAHGPSIISAMFELKSLINAKYDKLHTP